MNRLGPCLVFLASLAAGLAHAAERYEIDPGHTYPNFRVEHLGFSLMHGRFNDTSGALVIDRDGDGSRVEVVIQAASIDTGHDKRDAHLRSDDYFHVDKYPTLHYRSRSVQWRGETAATVIGELTLLGTTRPVELDVDRVKCGRHPFKQVYVCGFNATAMIKRSDFGMTEALGPVGDDIAIRIEAEAVRQDPGGGPRR